MRDQKEFIGAQWKFIVASAVSYAFFYIARKNLSMAQPEMLREGVISMSALGWIMTIHGVLYGCSRFINGFWADRLNGRVFMALGLALSAIMNFAFGMSDAAILFAVFWIVNGWTQGMGFPPCAKMLAHWIHPKELATKMSVWNASHSVGAVLALGICTFLFYLGFGWRACFLVPAALAALAAVFTFFCVKETPVEAGFEPIAIEAEGKREAAETVTGAERRRLVFGNRVIWLVALANFFVYIVRFGFLDWGPTFLKEYKNIPVTKGGLMIIAFELAAVVGTIVCGWATDKLFKGRGVRTGAIFMAAAARNWGSPIWSSAPPRRWTVTPLRTPRSRKTRCQRMREEVSDSRGTPGGTHGSQNEVAGTQSAPRRATPAVRRSAGKTGGRRRARRTGADRRQPRTLS